jgi:hypothetical protein
MTLGQPSSLAIVDSVLAVSDLRGTLLRCEWPDGSEPTLVKAHDDRGPVVAVGGEFATAGGWDPTVRRWSTGGRRPLWSARPVTGRITALCFAGGAGGAGGVVLAAGADRSTGDPSDRHADRLPLDPSRVYAFDDGGEYSVVLHGRGEITALAGGDGWWAAVDIGARQHLRLTVAESEADLPWLDDPVIVLAGHGRTLAVTTPRRVWRYHIGSGRDAMVIGELASDHPQLLALVIAGEFVVGSTSEGLVRFPDGRPIGRRGTQPVALAPCDDDDVLVLWPDRTIEQLSAGGDVRRTFALSTGV